MDNVKIIMKNKRAFHNYEILARHESGIVLQGTEVKAIRDGRINFTDSYARIMRGELWLIGLHISPYENGSVFNHDPDRDRKLLMHANEIERLRRGIEEKGLTLVPLSMYLKGGRVKIELGLGRGKHLYDKRHDSAERDAKREMERARKKSLL